MTLPSTTKQELAEELAKIPDLTEQLSNLKIENSILRAQNLAYSQPTDIHHSLDDLPYLIFVLGTDKGPHTGLTSLVILTELGTNIQNNPRAG